MVYGKTQLLLAFVLTALVGAGLHFVYGLCPNGVTALFSPVNESIWEHGKILFWPYLAAAVWLTWGRPTGLRPWLLTGVGICLIMFGVGYLLHVVLGWNSLAADLALYAALLALGFWLPTKMEGPFHGLRWRLPALMAAALVLGMVWFTFHPPQGALFVDLSQKQLETRNKG